MIEFEPKLRRNYHLSSERSKGFAHELFVGERAVDLSRIEECDAVFDCCTDNRDHSLLFYDRTVGAGHAHAAESDRRDFKIAVSKFSFLHFSPPVMPIVCMLCLSRDRTMRYCKTIERHCPRGSRDRAAPVAFLRKRTSLYTNKCSARIGKWLILLPVA